MTTNPLPARDSLRAWLALALAATSLAIAVWSVLPPANYLLLVLAVAAPEISPWLALAALIAAALALGRLRDHMPARIALACALSTIALVARPWLQFPRVAAEFEQTMQRALGDDYLRGLPPDVRRGLRPAVLSWGELWLGLPAGHVRTTRSVTFAAPGGEALTLDVYRPPRAGRYPIVVQIYGGAWQRGAPGDNAAFARYLAGHGYVVFAVDYRHAPCWTWPAQIEDIRAALVWIGAHAAEYDADSARLALLGRSSGAQLALVAAYTPAPLPVRAVVSYYGPVDLVTGYREPPHPDPLGVRAVEEALLGGTPDTQPQRYAQASPLGYADARQPPTLLVYAGRDHIVESRFGAALDARLRASGTTSVLLVVPWAEHAFDAVPGGPSAQLALYHTERFLAWALYGTRAGS
jgi:acetyl esterase/lipase